MPHFKRGFPMRAMLATAVLLGGLAAGVAAPVPEVPITKEHLETTRANLKQIGLAFHASHDANEFLPGDIVAKDGKALLSWRVAILPYIEETPLYKQFKLDEPWDSENNKKLIEKMPKLYAPVRVKANAGLTFYQSFYGPKTVFDPKAKRPTLAAISNANGVSNTVLVVEAGVPTVWTKPLDLPLDPKKPLPKLGGMFNGDFHVVFCDGAVRLLRTTTNLDELKKAIDPNNDQPFDLKK
jgi:hypothetical protein